MTGIPSMLTGLVLSMAISATALPPGVPVANHGGPGKYTQPTIRRFERREVDDERRAAWNTYVSQLDALWDQYRAAGSTPDAFQQYQDSAMAAKRRYVYQDPYLTAVPVSDPCPCDDGCPAPCAKATDCVKSTDCTKK